jgi:hypothetical protein
MCGSLSLDCRDHIAPKGFAVDIREKPHDDTVQVTVVELIGATTTKTGLKVECKLDTRTYKKGIKVSKAEMAQLNITGDAFHPQWNYTITPRQQPP